jgi:hypothetical protein
MDVKTKDAWEAMTDPSQWGTSLQWTNIRTVVLDLHAMVRELAKATRDALGASTPGSPGKRYDALYSVIDRIDGVARLAVVVEPPNDLIQRLREQTGAGKQDARDALVESKNNLSRAYDLISTRATVGGRPYKKPAVPPPDVEVSSFVRVPCNELRVGDVTVGIVRNGKDEMWHDGVAIPVDYIKNGAPYRKWVQLCEDTDVVLVREPRPEAKVPPPAPVMPPGDPPSWLEPLIVEQATAWKGMLDRLDNADVRDFALTVLAHAARRDEASDKSVLRERERADALAILKQAESLRDNAIAGMNSARDERDAVLASAEELQRRIYGAISVCDGVIHGDAAVNKMRMWLRGEVKP